MTEGRIVVLIVFLFGLAASNPTPVSVEQAQNSADTTEWVPVGLPDEEEITAENNNIDDEYDETNGDVNGDDDKNEDENEDDDEADEEDSTLRDNNSTSAVTESQESKVLQTGMKKRKVKNTGLNKKMAMKMLPLLLIPLMIQAQIIPLMLFKLKMMALKALMIGKAALLIVLINILRNAFIGADSMEEQYEQQTLASSHYGYSGGPEYGAWINKKRRVFVVPTSNSSAESSPYRGYQKQPTDAQIMKRRKFKNKYEINEDSQEAESVTVHSPSHYRDPHHRME